MYAINPNLYSPVSNLSNPVEAQPAYTLLFVGSTTESLDKIRNKHQNTIISLEYENDLDTCIKWLYRQVKHPGPHPVAVLIDTSWGVHNICEMLRYLSSSIKLRNIPVLVLSERAADIQETRLRQYGVDDCYIYPLEWDVILTKISFLWAYKSRLLRYQKQKPEQYERTPMQFSKRLADVLLSASALVILSPFFFLTALAIRLESPGPVFYCSKRAGRNFKVFSFWKFRSMYADADERLQEMRAQNQYGADATFVKFKNDPRITKVGRFIRKYSIDELPQLYNILIGDMSLVGNRPLPLYEAEQLLTEDYSERFLAPAGLTGLWQVSKRGSDDMSAEERIALDVQYARQHSAMMDLKIIFKTFTAFIQKENV